MSQRNFIVVFILLNIISLILSQNFIKIFEYNHGRFRGITKNGSMIAFATENTIIIGTLDNDSFGFTEIKTLLTPDLIGQTELIEFKFIDENYIIICNENGCCLFSILIAAESNPDKNNCIFLPLKTNGSRIDAMPLESINIQKINQLLFLRAVFSKAAPESYLFTQEIKKRYGVFFRSYNFENGVLLHGVSLDSLFIDHQFKSIYSFIHGSHTYFIDYIVRENVALKNLPFEYAKSYSKNNTDIVITQICNNDESPEIRSRTDLILSCEGIRYDDPEAITKHEITAALYLSETSTLLIGIRGDKTVICKFNMTEVAEEFQKTWSFCQENVTRSLNDCNATSYDELVDAGCFKVEWEPSFWYNFPVKSYFSPCQNTRNASSFCCENSVISRSSLPNTEIYGYQNFEPFYGESIYSASDFDVIALYPSSENFNEIFVLTSESKLIKIPLLSSYITTMREVTFDFGVKSFNQRFLTPWKEKEGFIFIDPSTKKSVYFKNATCDDRDGCDEMFVTRSFTCGKCPEDDPFTDFCNLEMQTICPPMWYNGDVRRYAQNLWKDDWIESEFGKKIAQCFWTTNAQNCSDSLNDYLKPIVAIPYHFSENEISDINKFWDFSVLIIPVSIILLVTVAFFSWVCFYHKNKKISKKKNNSADSKLNEFNKRYLISSKNVVLLELLGSGFTSDVHLANLTDNSSPIKVAVKTLKITVKKADILKEIKFLSLCKHSNIVSFIGWIDHDPQTCIITEFMGGGDLHAYLIAPSNLLMSSTIFTYIFQILDAMIYLSHQKILHRDLAARNCLLNETYEILKINDFGLSRKMNIDYQYVSDATPDLPFKWLPLESLFPTFSQYKTFTQKGDIWSFGILIWEMFERGTDLYPGLNLQSLRNFLKSGQRLPCPKHCPHELYKIMLWCWEKDAENRPNFHTIKTDTEVIYQYIKIHQSHKLNFSVEVTSQNGYECPKRTHFN